MANLAIKGHATRGSEVINILEMLGGINKWEYLGDRQLCVYYINCDGIINYTSNIKGYNLKIFTLDEFIEKYPYKVGDEVILKRNNKKAIIDKVTWCCDTITYWIKYDGYIEGNWRVDNLQPYKEQETMDEKKLYKKLDFTQELSSEKVELILGDYEVKEENGKTYLVKKQPKYPKSYDDCCEVLNECAWETPNTCYKGQLMLNLQKLLICRDAYWKIAGDWKPDFIKGGVKYCLVTERNIVIPLEVFYINNLLIFPTKEMRDAFYENFKERINEVKELL